VVRAAPSVADETDAMSHDLPRRLPRVTRLAITLMLGVAVAWLTVLPSQVRAQGSTVLVTRVDGTITPVIADHLVDGVAAAKRDGHAA
jgi:membrane-bound serine protease (ClpP class)